MIRYYLFNCKIEIIIIHPILLPSESVQIAPGDRKIKCCICTVDGPTDKIKAVFVLLIENTYCPLTK